MLRSRCACILKFFSILICSLLFGLLMQEIFTKYLKKTTTTGLRFGAFGDDKKPLPAITFCPLAGFKQEGFHYKVADVVRNTVDLSEIFSNSSLNEIANHIYMEPLAQQFGRCYSYHSNEEHAGKFFFLKTKYELEIFIHQKGDVLWFTLFREFPYEVSSAKLALKTNMNDGLANLALREIRSLRYPTPEMPCSDTGSENEHEKFIECCRKSLWRNLHMNINCTVADMIQIIPNNSVLPECSNRYDAHKVYWEFNGLFARSTRKIWMQDCPLPCRQTYYKLNLNYYHKNNAFIPDRMANMSDGNFGLYLYWSFYPDEERIESLEYDIANLLVSAGGNLGLFLGFSCLSVLYGIIDMIRARFQI